MFKIDLFVGRCQLTCDPSVVDSAADRHAAARIFVAEQTGEGNFARSVQTRNRIAVSYTHLDVYKRQDEYVL